MSFLDEIGPRDFPDRAIRYLLQHPRNLQELVERVAPDVAGRLDFNRMTAVPREFLMEDWRRRELDLLFEVPLRAEDREQPVLVCILLEHQSTADSRMPLRMLLYAVLYWERSWKDWEAERRPGEPLRLSPVLPIIFHTGGDPWRTNRQLPDLFDVPEPLKGIVPHWPILLWDLAEQSPQQLIQETGDWIRALAVVRTERDESDAFQQTLGDVLQRLEQLSTSDEMRWHDLVGFVLSWAIYRRPRVEVDQVKRTAAASLRDRRHRREVQTMIEAAKQTWAEWAFEQGEERGLAKGIAEGRAKGMAEGRAEGELQARRDDLKDVLVERFGEISDELQGRIEATADIQRLKSCLRQALRIESLDELSL